MHTVCSRSRIISQRFRMAHPEEYFLWRRARNVGHAAAPLGCEELFQFKSYIYIFVSFPSRVTRAAHSPLVAGIWWFCLSSVYR